MRAIGGLTSGPKPLRWRNSKLRALLRSILDDDSTLRLVVASYDFHNQGETMADSDRTAALKGHMDRDFMPDYGTSGLKPELRMANAAEYATHQLGQIRKDIARIADALEKIAAKP